MECFKVENLSFTYPERQYKALDNISFTVNQSEFVLICGKSGCGKTTLLRLLKSSLAPFGKTEGNIWLNGKTLKEYNNKEQASKIGFVMQNPDNHIVTDKVWHELAFGLESIGVKQNEIRARVSEMASFFGIENWFYKSVDELSGGQKQLLNLASVMVMNPEVLILDEPTSQLDPIASGEFLSTLEKINRELGTTVILTEHRLEDAFSLADRVIVMDNGRVMADEKPEEVGRILKDNNHDMYMSLPTPVRVYSSVKNDLSCPVAVREGRNWLEEYAKSNTLNPAVIPEDKVEENNDTIIEIRDAWFRYEKELPDVLKGFNLSVKKGELFCITGGNGTGKTTALSLVSGLNKPYRGEVYIKGQKISKINNLYEGILGVLPQNPQSVFVKNTVYLDLMEMLSDKKLTKGEKEQKILNIATLCRIENLLNSHPYDLSGGEQQRTALAKVLLLEPEILILDEPTKGMDACFKYEFAEILSELKLNGVTILMVSHDIEFCAAFADRCALCFDGNLTSVDTSRGFFKGKNFYTTSANRMARTCLPDAVLPEDIILACGANLPKRERKDTQPKENRTEVEVAKKEEAVPKSKIKKSTVLAILSAFLLVPLTIYIGTKIFGSRKYFFISLLIIIETMVPFLMLFEWRKPMAREIVLISVLCAITVIGRVIFFMTPHFKPTLALLIITGVCLGAETGFLVGVVTGFLSNFFYGQGPWTPWQMFALGIIGFLSGIVFRRCTLKRNKVTICIFGFLVALVIYGGIMNPASIIMWQNKITLPMIVTSYVAGLPLDLVHAFATAFFLWFISGPMMEKIERIKVKYGLIKK